MQARPDADNIVLVVVKLCKIKGIIAVKMSQQNVLKCNPVSWIQPINTRQIY